jgi:signal transduction histidine kinase
MLKKKSNNLDLLSKLEKNILTPITFIQGYVSILKNDKELSEQVIDKVNRIERSAERVMTTTQALLTAFQIENKKQKFKLESIPLLSTVHESIDKYIRLAKIRKIKFILEGQNTSNVITNKKCFVQALSILSQEILLALEKGTVDVLIKREGSDMCVNFTIIFNQQNQIKISETPGYELAELFLNKSKNKLTFSKKDNIQKITIRLGIDA